MTRLAAILAGIETTVEHIARLADTAKQINCGRAHPQRTERRTTMTRDEVRAKLAELPDTADGIAAFLAERGVKGQMGGPTACPLAHYVGGDVWVWTTFASIGKSESVSLPLAATLFIARFDRGAYPELIA